MVPEKVWARILLDPDTCCWLWAGHRIARGYGLVWNGGKTPEYLHRIMYEEFVGPIPAGLEIDHLCEVPACCNPGHLEAVTHRENMLRGPTIAARNAARTHCPSGHPYEGDNLKLNKRGYRLCRACKRARNKKWLAEKRAKARQ